jgi:hypothetical protein
MSALSIARFAAPATSSIPLPTGPTLALPGGVLGVCDAGRVFVFDRWLVAVAVSADFFIVLSCVSERQVPGILREQLAGYLSALGAEVVRLRIRFPLGWHLRGSLSRTIIFWVFRFIETLSVSLEPNLGRDRPRLALPIGILARQAHEEWLWIARILGSIADECPAELPPLDWLLWEMSHRWEIKWALTLRDAEQYGYITPEDRTEVELCDRAWIALIRGRLIPHGYVLLPDTMARML